MSEPKKAVALISGGLDSMLAAKTILDQGIHVEGINFFTGFCVEGHTHAIRKKDNEKAKPKRNNALWAAEQLGIKLHIVDVIEEYKNVLLNPKHGYGANLNPCLDCKIFMVNKAKQWIEENGFDFIITGEVVGQRPMSQRRFAMPLVAERSGADDLLLRPLSARNLPETKPEREGWVDRNKLHDFGGRTRRPQIAMAEQFGFTDYAQPAGGCCFLTDKSYSQKLVDLWQARGARDYELDDVMLLKVGRHIRPKPHFKLIIAREEGEGRFMEGYKNDFISLHCSSHTGPLALIDGSPDAADLELAAAIIARYSKGKDGEQVEVAIRTADGQESRIKTRPLTVEQLLKEWFI